MRDGSFLGWPKGKQMEPARDGTVPRTDATVHVYIPRRGHHSSEEGHGASAQSRSRKAGSAQSGEAIAPTVRRLKGQMQKPCL